MDNPSEVCGVSNIGPGRGGVLANVLYLCTNMYLQTRLCFTFTKHSTLDLTYADFAAPNVKKVSDCGGHLSQLWTQDRVMCQVLVER